ncbi:class I SAM-dependent methyltransferase [Micromonospora sp. D93]|uniref:class I SAM-dependent methyltransferase n=1 Tax=Micromonospora sp. D93 TaxID=2824886 RepID=UPI001B360DF4|nr:class I SAM-dependent methyltransferase [Micromonospora sp. D93]MBQ1019092.1 class I SAM-dependent methyltransferase [Micromonospora sp. D93]
MATETGYHDELGEFFAQNANTSPYNAYTDRPAMLALAGDVANADILDVGCGAGHYAAELLARGARVTGIDASATLLRHAHSRAARAELRLHDLEQPLDFAADASFDGIVCALVIHHVTNRRQLLAEMRRVLCPAGWLVISITHPTADWRYFGGSYYDQSWVDLPHGPGVLHFQRTTLETFLGELLDAGFTLEKLVEPRPCAELREVDEAAYTRLTERPSFLAARLRSGL